MQRPAEPAKITAQVNSRIPHDGNHERPPADPQFLASSPTSTTARAPSPTACSSAPAPSPSASSEARSSTTWTSNANAASPSRPPPSPSLTPTRTPARSTCSTSSTRPATSISTTKSPKALQACEGAILVVDATQGVQAQTVANAYAAIDAEPGDHPRHQQDRSALAPSPTRSPRKSSRSSAFDAEDCILVSAKTGQGIDELLEAHRRTDSRRPRATADAPLAGPDLRLPTTTTTAASSSTSA